MPLFTDNIDVARTAYEALEARTLSAEEHARVLERALAQFTVQPGLSDDERARLHRRVLELEASNIELTNKLDALAKSKEDMLLQNFVESLGLALAIGEASMPDRSISSASTTLQAHFALTDGQIGIRLHPPELGAVASGLSSTGFELAKIPPQPGVPAAPKLYSVFEDKQATYTSSFWARFERAAQVITEVSKALADSGGWTFSYLVQSAARIGELEKQLSTAVRGAAQPKDVDDYANAASALVALASVLSSKPTPVAGDSLRLSTALRATTDAARTLHR